MTTLDEFGPLAEWMPFVQSLPEPKHIVTIPAADHFFDGALPELELAIQNL